MIACNNTAMCEGGDQNDKGFFDNCIPLVGAADTNALATDISGKLINDGWACLGSDILTCTKADETKSIELLQVGTESILLYGTNDNKELDTAANAFVTGEANVSAFPINLFAVGLANMPSKCTEDLGFLQFDLPMANTTNMTLSGDTYLEFVLAQFIDGEFFGRNDYVMAYTKVNADKFASSLEQIISSAPTVKSTFPQMGTVDVSTHTNIKVDFNNEMDTSIAPSISVTTGQQEVAISASWDNGGRSINVQLDQPLFPRTTYIVIVRGGTMKDTVGNTFKNNYIFYFTSTCANEGERCLDNRDCCGGDCGAGSTCITR